MWCILIPGIIISSWVLASVILGIFEVQSVMISAIFTLAIIAFFLNHFLGTGRS
jgi:hypothetical protein